ncbi:hypothetical protein, partial [Salinibacter ruber]|uniref:hypothetical protein n=1 Tax=Salinibacter ruber TaxID=146919 RepID=UPI001C86EDD1
MDPKGRKPRESNPELRAGQRWSRQAGGRNRSLNEPSVERVGREANYAMSEEGWAEADVRALGWPDGVGRLKLAELRTGRWQETERLSKSRQEGWKKEDSRERGPRGKSESASGIENGPGSRGFVERRGIEPPIFGKHVWFWFMRRQNVDLSSR